MRAPKLFNGLVLAALLLPTLLAGRPLLLYDAPASLTKSCNTTSLWREGTAPYTCP